MQKLEIKACSTPEQQIRIKPNKWQALDFIYPELFEKYWYTAINFSIWKVHKKDQEKTKYK